MKEYNKKYYLEHKSSIQARHHDYRNTPKGRAIQLITNYKWRDKRDGYKETVDFDEDWMVKNIMEKPCVHCGKTGWKFIGCNRLDNTKGHTMSNVEPCCKACNDKLGLEYQWQK